jgi:shikimate kinase / 3-dehydroquinate synthase
MTSKPLILAGFMGTGKSTVGQLCARQLGYEFIDADVEIVRREGMSIPQVFEHKGEAYFRALEAALVAELIQREQVVIATGGGMIVDEANRRALLRAGVCVGLTASPGAILSRVDAATRPMLRTSTGTQEAVSQRVAALLKARAPAYRELHYTLDTTVHSPEETAAHVLAIYRAEQARIAVKVPANSDHVGHYDILFGEGVIDQLGSAMAGRGWTAPFAIVSDDTVAPLHAERVRQALGRAGIDAFIHSLRPGESHKTLQSVEDIYRACSQHGLERSSAIVAVGGGVVGDVAGFAAATYLRGVPFVQAPTSLLAMADSSIGGKVGVDTSFGKNLVGAFKQPEMVAIDTGCLRTLPMVELRCGYAEIVKAALISGGDAYRRVIASAQQHFVAGQSNEWVIAPLRDAIELKRQVVEEDPYEKGRRALLNLGHTFGHGLETWSHFAVKHGEGVSLGMVCAVRLSHMLGLCSGDLAEEVTGLLADAGLPVSLPGVDADAVWQLMQSDKKKQAGKLRFIVPRAPGDVFITSSVTEAQARQALASLALD